MATPTTPSTPDEWLRTLGALRRSAHASTAASRPRRNTPAVFAAILPLAQRAFEEGHSIRAIVRHIMANGWTASTEWSLYKFLNRRLRTRDEK